jgi:FkbM family methyltransferase
MGAGSAAIPMNTLFEIAKPLERAVKKYGDRQVHYRVGTSDESVLAECLEKHVYRRLNLCFDVERGEHWLDLGANIGAFAVYCQLRSASVVCFEPDSSNLELLRLNAPEADIYASAVTNQKAAKLLFKKGKSATDFSRATILGENLPEHPEGELWNTHGAFLKEIECDGCKMDIEGSEFGLIDEELLPNCRKLVMEYHILRDHGNLLNFARRMQILHKHFAHVHYAPSVLNGAVEGKYQGRFDVPVFAWN